MDRIDRNKTIAGNPASTSSLHFLHETKRLLRILLSLNSLSVEAKQTR